MDWYYSAIVGLLGLLGGVVGTRLVTNYLALRSGRAGIATRERRDVQEEQQKFMGILQGQYDRLAREFEDFRRQHAQQIEDCHRERAEARELCARAEERITVLEDTLTSNGFEVRRPWVRPGPGSGRHHPPQSPPPSADGGA